MGYKRCFEYHGCKLKECPAWGEWSNDRCWMVTGTMCRDRGCNQSLDEKIDICFSNCQYFRDRTDLAFGDAKPEVLKRILKKEGDSNLLNRSR